jgi:hypothetical protein
MACLPGGMTAPTSCIPHQGLADRWLQSQAAPPPPSYALGHTTWWQHKLAPPACARQLEPYYGGNSPSEEMTECWQGCARPAANHRRPAHGVMSIGLGRDPNTRTGTCTQHVGHDLAQWHTSRTQPATWTLDALPQHRCKPAILSQYRTHVYTAASH